MITRLTQEGYKKLENELNELSNVRRKEIAQQLHEAMEDVDFEDSSELDMIRSEQAFVEGRILELRSILASAEIVEKSEALDKIDVGSLVTLREGKETTTYLIVNPVEANPEEFKISFKSPIGKALFQKEVGEVVKVKTPDGEITLEIISIA